MTCETFRNTLQVDDRRADVLEHLRSCDACLDFAVTIDPDVLFRAIGGEETVPPGGIDQFVTEVMQQVHLRDRESDIRRSRPVVAWPYRLAAAAALTFVVTSSVLFTRSDSDAIRPESHVAMLRPAATHVMASSARPAVEDYASDKATIVEVPTEGAGDVKIVMVFDESLPANL